jgi:hypothetical protein
LFQTFDTKLDALEIKTVQKETLHTHRAQTFFYSLHKSGTCRQIQSKSHLTSIQALYYTISPLLGTPWTNWRARSTGFDVQLRWGGYDLHDIERFIELIATDLASTTCTVLSVTGIPVIANH